MHVFYDVHLGASHKSLAEIMKQKQINKGEVAVFLNKAWTGAKLLTTGGVLLYWRSPWNTPITVEQLRSLPSTTFGGSRMNFTGNLEDRLLKALAKGTTKSIQTAREA